MKKKKYNKLKLLKLASRSKIGTMPKPQVVKSKKDKQPRYKEDYSN